MKELALNILDIVQNSIAAKASRVVIKINEDFSNNTLSITISDNGFGIKEKMLGQVVDPYVTSRKTRKVGMGLPLLNHACKLTGGEMTIDSKEGIGTTVVACMGLNHIDRQPIGDIAGVVVLLVSANPEIVFNLQYNKNGNEYFFNSSEVKEILDGIPLNQPEIMKVLRDMVRSNLEEL